MYLKKKFSYGISQELKAKVLELPYKGEKLSMVILLPNQTDGITALKEELTADHLMNFETTFKVYKEITVAVYLPRLKLEASIDLEKVLTGLGLKDAFDAHKADFSGMDGSRNLFISRVIHKAFIDAL